MADPNTQTEIVTFSQAPYPTAYPTSYAPYPTAVGQPVDSQNLSYPPPGGAPPPGGQFQSYPPPGGAPPPGGQFQSYPPPGGAPPPCGQLQSYPPPGGAPPPGGQSQYYPTLGGPPPAYGMQPQQPVFPPEQAPSTDNPEVGYKDDDGMFSFNDKSVRLAFIRKVYGVLALQMLVTVALSCLFMFHEPTKYFVQNHIGFYIAAYVLFLVLYFVLACCTSVARKYPTNLILLGIFTLSLAYMVGAITSFHDTKIVLMVFVLTLVVCVSVMLFACQTKYDFTTCGGMLFVLTICLIFFGLFAAILVPTGHIKIANMVYAGLGALLFMAFLAFDTQLIMGGKKYELDPEDYVFAAMMLFVDIIYIFLFLLSLFGGSD